jgi:hypothetical protein
MEVIAMGEPSKRSSMYLDSALPLPFRIKAAHTHPSISDRLDDAVRMALREDQESLAPFKVK